MARATDLEHAVASRAPEVRAAAMRLRHLVRELFPEAVESGDGRNFGFGFAPGYKGLVFVITPAKDHVGLGVARGTELPDPQGLLEGKGRVHRHVKLRSAAEADAPALRALALAALDTARARWETPVKGRPAGRRRTRS